MTEGDSLKIKLTDDNGTAIANQTVNVTITDENSTSDYHSVVTDGDGTGMLKLDKDPGEYTVTISYDGNENYTGCNTTQKLTIKEKVKEEVVQATTVEQSSSEPVYYGEDGSIISEADYMTLQVYGKSANSPEEWEAQKHSLGY
ncbi:carboxypeptidase-like regulatory domain-containing protein [Methanobrevibacter sp.]